MHYRVVVVASWAGHAPREVYRGEVDPEIMAGRQTLQARPFGRRYHVDGCVFEDDCPDTALPGLRCSFEPITP